MAHATHHFVDPTEFSQPPLVLAPEEAVVLVDGTLLLALGVVDVPISIQGYKEMVQSAVIDLSNDYDLILGDQ